MAYRVEEASLTAVADAIREKTGTSEGLSFPEGFVNAVAGIQAGGGENKLFITEITPETDIYNGNNEGVFLQHGLGAIPDFVIVHRKDHSTGINGNSVLISGAFLREIQGDTRRYNAYCAKRRETTNGYDTVSYGSGNMSYNNKITNTPSPVRYLDEKEMEIIGSVDSSTRFLQAGAVYRVIAGLF